MDEKDFMYVYDPKMFEFLKSKGFRFIIKALHHKTHRPFSMYYCTPKLQEAIDEWNNSKRQA